MSESGQQALKRRLSQSQVKELRERLQNFVNIIDSHVGSRELSLVKTKLEEAKMWAGKELGNLGGEDLNAKRDSEENREESGLWG